MMRTKSLVETEKMPFPLMIFCTCSTSRNTGGLSWFFFWTCFLFLKQQSSNIQSHRHTLQNGVCVPVCTQRKTHMQQLISVFLHMLPAAAQRQPAAPLQCCSLCKSGNTPAVGGTLGGRSAHHTSWRWASQMSALWTRLYPEQHCDSRQLGQSDDTERELDMGVGYAVHKVATRCQCWQSNSMLQKCEISEEIMHCTH